MPAVTEAQIEDIENAYPNFKMVATARTALNSRYDMTLRMNYFGPHYDENGRIDGVDGNPKSKQLGATVFMDVEITGSFRDKWELTFGLMNLFDIYPDKIEDPYANLLNQGMPYALRSPANFEGGSWYLSGSRKW